jgi:uncharacterized protein (TIGR02646 family)
LWLQQNKCAFCERLLVAEAGYAHSERDLLHFRPKQIYPRLAYEILNYLVACKSCAISKRGEFPLEGVKNPRLTNPSLGRAEKPLLIYPIGSIDEDPEQLIGFEGLLAIPLAHRGYRHRRAQVTIELFRLNSRNDLLHERAEQISKTWIVLALLERSPDRDVLAANQSILHRLTSGASPHANCVRSFQRLYWRDPQRARNIYQAVIDYLHSRASTESADRLLPDYPVIAQRLEPSVTRTVMRPENETTKTPLL